MENMIPLLCVVGFVVIFAAIAAWTVIQARKRREALREQALVLGCTFEEGPVAPDETTYGRLDLFQHGRSRMVSNALSRSTDRGGRLIACDYRYTTGGGKNSSVHHCSVVLIQVPGARIPAFSLQPENFLHRFFELVGLKDIDFSEDEEFSKKIHLRGEDENAVRAFFNPELRAALSAQTTWLVDGAGEWLAFHRPNHRVRPEEIGAFIEEARALAEFFMPRRTTSGW